MDLAALGLSVDSGPLSKAVQELRQVPAAARSAAAGADQVVGAAERMARAMTQSTAAANQNVRALQVVGSASRAAMQQMANSFAGVRDFDTGSLISYGRELDAIRAKYNPLFAAGRQYRETLQDINVALKMGAISEKERSEAIARTKAEFAGQVAGINATSAALRGNANALRAVAIQIPDVIQGIAMGQSGFQIFTQQGLQTVQVLGMQPGGIGGAFKELGKWAGAFLTPARLAAGGILAIGTAALTAAAQYQSAQRQMSTSLLGSGRASGATVGDLNQAASAGASTFGLSISEAREFAATLAQTGKIGVEEIGKIVKVGHDVATVYGIDATEAAGLLAQSFADPVRGAEKLNERLGFLSARMQSDIASLVAQNRLYDAQRLLLSGVASSVEGAQTSLSGMAKGWAAVGNAISNAWGALGEWTSRALNMVPPETGQRINDLRRELESVGGEIEVQQHLLEKGYGSNALDEAKVKYEMLREELERLVAQQEKYKESVERTQRATESRVLAGVATRVIPEGQQLKDLKDQYSALKTALDKANASGGESAKIFSDLPFSYSQLATAVERAKGAVEGFKTEYEKTVASLKLDISAVGAKGPGALGNIAYQRSLLQSGSNSSEAVAKAELDRTLAIKQAQQQIHDTQNARLLSSRQATETAQMELSVLGKSVAEQEAMRGKLAARQQLEQEALQTYGNRDAYDRAHLASLEKEVEKQAAIKQLLAEQQLKRDVKFQTDTLFMSSGDQQIASTLRNVYGDDWKSQMDGALAQQMRINNALVEAKNAAVDFTASMVEGFAKGEDMVDVLERSLASLGSQLIRMGSQNLIGSLFQGVGANGQQTGGLLGGGLTSLLGMAGSMAGPIGGLLATGAGMLLTTLFNDKNDEETAKQTQQLQEAQRVWKEAGPSFTRFINEMTGLGTGGDLSSKFQSVASNLNQIFKDAAAAYDFGAIAKAASASIHYQITQSQQFLATWNSAISGFQSGGGVLKATDAVKSELDRVLAFLDDTRTAMNTLAGSSDFGATADLANAAGLQWVADGMNAAREAGKSYLLSLVDNKSAMSDVAKQLAEVTATADAVRAALVSLNVSAEDAAAAVNDRLASALSGMASAFNTTLTEEINNLSGRGWANDAGALLKDYQQKLADAALIGGDSDLVTRWFKLSAQNIVDGARLTGSAFNELITQFPELQGVVTAFVEAAKDAADRIKTYQDQLFIAQQDDQTLTGALAIFDLQAQREREQEIAAGGQALAALEALQAQKRLNIIEDFNKKALDEAQRAADEQKRVRDRELEEQKRAIEQTIEQNKRFVESLRAFKDSLALDSLSVLSPYQKLLEAQSQFRQTAVAASTGDTAAQGRLESIARTYLSSAREYYGSGQGYTSIYQSVNATLDGVLSNAEAQLSDAQRQLEQLELQTNALNTIASNTAALVSLMSGGGAQEPSWVAQLPSIPSYADGTNYHAGGMALVGERGPEIVNLPRGSQVRPSSNNDNDNIAALLERIIDVLATTGRMNVTESARTANAVQNLSRRLSSKELSRVKAS